MVPDSFDQDVKTFLQAIVLCVQNELIMPAVALIFTLIDTMAWLSLEEDKVAVRGADFERWVDEFLLPGSGLLCNASELYGARCGILHTHTAESGKSRAGAAREVYYAWGKGEERQLQARIEASGLNACAVHVNKLYLALERAIHRCIKGLNEDPTRAKVAWERAQKIFGRIDVRRLGALEQEQPE